MELKTDDMLALYTAEFMKIEQGGNMQGSPDILTTCVVIAYINKVWPSEKDICQHVCRRAVRWVNRAVKQAGGTQYMTVNGLTSQFGRLFANA